MGGWNHTPPYRPHPEQLILMRQSLYQFFKKKEQIMFGSQNSSMTKRECLNVCHSVLCVPILMHSNYLGTLHQKGHHKPVFGCSWDKGLVSTVSIVMQNVGRNGSEPPTNKLQHRCSEREKFQKYATQIL